MIAQKILQEIHQGLNLKYNLALDDYSLNEINNMATGKLLFEEVEHQCGCFKGEATIVFFFNPTKNVCDFYNHIGFFAKSLKNMERKIIVDSDFKEIYSYGDENTISITFEFLVKDDVDFNCQGKIEDYNLNITEEYNDE